MAEPMTLVSYQGMAVFKVMLDKLLADSGGAALAVPCAVGELEDLTVRVGTLVNAGAGWNTFAFPAPFEGAPQVTCRCDGHEVEVKSATATQFLYRVFDRAAVSAATAGYYVHNAKTAATGSMVEASLVTGVSGGGTTSVADPVEVQWQAVEYGGDA